MGLRSWMGLECKDMEWYLYVHIYCMCISICIFICIQTHILWYTTTFIPDLFSYVWIYSYLQLAPGGILSMKKTIPSGQMWAGVPAIYLRYHVCIWDISMCIHNLIWNSLYDIVYIFLYYILIFTNFCM
jgi:hypothetical protein